MLHKEKRAFVDHQRKMHEQLMREHKDFMALTSRIKATNASQSKIGAPPTGNAGIEDLLKECTQVLGKRN